MHKKWNALPYLLVMPTVILVLAVLVYPLVSDFWESMYSSSLLSQGSHFVGLSNYFKIFTDSTYRTVALNTAVWVLGSVIGQIFLGIVVALILNQHLKGKAIFRTLILIIPWATPDVVVASTWKWMYNAQFGIINQMLMQLHLIKAPHDWLGSTGTALASVVIANIWKGFPISAMLILAGLQGIPASLYEAARIDRANTFQQFWYITLPGLRRVLSTTILLTIIWTMNYFPLVYLMTGGGPVISSDIFVTNIYRTAFKYYNFGTASAIAIFIFFLVILFTTVYVRVTRVSGEEE